ncbi:MAG: hypothetical protein IJZ64_02145 [Ruminococcus sp.]|nr:hypothetical protein [Ruminococcus sp.]
MAKGHHYYSMEDAMKDEILSNQLKETHRKQAKQERKEKAIAIGVVLLVFPIALVLLLYYLKDKTEKLVAFFRMFIESPLYTTCFIVVFCTFSFGVYFFLRKCLGIKKCDKKNTRLLNYCLIFGGLIVGIGYIIILKVTKFS